MNVNLGEGDDVVEIPGDFRLAHDEDRAVEKMSHARETGGAGADLEGDSKRP